MVTSVSPSPAGIWKINLLQQSPSVLINKHNTEHVSTNTPAQRSWHQRVTHKQSQDSVQRPWKTRFFSEKLNEWGDFIYELKKKNLFLIPCSSHLCLENRNDPFLCQKNRNIWMLNFKLSIWHSRENWAKILRKTGTLQDIQFEQDRLKRWAASVFRKLEIRVH